MPAADAFGDERVLVGITTVGAALQGPGRISVSGGDRRRSLGHRHRRAWAGPRPAHRGRERGRGPHGGRPADPGQPDVAELIWGKLALAAMSPLARCCG